MSPSLDPTPRAPVRPSSEQPQGLLGWTLVLRWDTHVPHFILVNELPGEHCTAFQISPLKQTVPSQAHSCPGLHHWASGGWVGDPSSIFLGASALPFLLLWGSCSGQLRLRRRFGPDACQSDPLPKTQVGCLIAQAVPNFLVPGTVPWKTIFPQTGRWFQNDSSTFVYCTSFLSSSHQLHLRSSGVRPQRWGTPALINSRIERTASIDQGHLGAPGGL